MKVYSFGGKIFLCAVYGLTWVTCQDCCSSGAPNIKVPILHWSIESGRYQRAQKRSRNGNV